MALPTDPGHAQPPIWSELFIDLTLWLEIPELWPTTEKGDFSKNMATASDHFLRVPTAPAPGAQASPAPGPLFLTQHTTLAHTRRQCSPSEAPLGLLVVPPPNYLGPLLGGQRLDTALLGFLLQSRVRVT